MILQFVQPRALGRKASDEFAVRLCRTHLGGAHKLHCVVVRAQAMGELLRQQQGGSIALCRYRGPPARSDVRTLPKRCSDMRNYAVRQHPTFTS